MILSLTRPPLTSKFVPQRLVSVETNEQPGYETATGALQGISKMSIQTYFRWIWN